MVSNLEAAKVAMQALNQVQSPVSASTTIPRQRMDEISKMIKEERMKQNMTQTDLAKKSGYSQGTITRAENNLWISIYCLVSIFEALGKKIELKNK